MIVILYIVNSVAYKKISVNARIFMNGLQQGQENQLDDTWDKRLLCQDTLFSRRFIGVFLGGLVSIRVEIIEGTTSKVEKVERRNSQ